MKYYSIHEFSKLISRTPQTLRNWDLSGKLKPHHTGANGYRYYSHQQLTVFSCKLQGKRANKTRKLVDELIAESENYD